MANELIEGFSAYNAQKLRDDVVHGLKDVETLVQRCSEFRRHLIHILNAAILHTLGPSVDSWITGHYELHPGGRISLKFNQALSQDLYQGQWIEGLTVKAEPIATGQDSSYPAIVTFEWQLPEIVIKMIKFKSEELFMRDSNIYSFPNEAVVSGLPTWPDRPSEPAWE